MRLKTLTASLAMAATSAFVAQGAVLNSEGFEAYAEGTTLTNGYTATSATADWENAYFWYEGAENGDASVVSNYNGGATSAKWPDAFDGVGDKYLSLSTEGGTLFRGVSHVTSGGLAAAQNLPEAGLYIDTLVQFTPCEDAPTFTGSENKLAIWLNVNTNASGEATSTNLCARAGFVKKDGDSLVTEDRTFSLNTLDASEVKAGTWYRLTVRAIKDLDLRTGANRAGFQIYLDDKLMSSSEKACSDEAYAEMRATAQGLFDAKTVFPSMKTDATLQAVGFQGTGAIDDLVITEDAPSYLQVDFTLTWDSSVAAIETSFLSTNDLTGAGSVNLKVPAGAKYEVALENITFKTGSASGIWTGSGLTGFAPIMGEGEVVEGYQFSVAKGAENATLNIVSAKDPDQNPYSVGPGANDIYPTLEAAIAALTGASGKVTLTRAINLTGEEKLSVPSGANVVLDLAGQTVTGAVDKAVIVNAGTLFITNSVAGAQVVPQVDEESPTFVFNTATGVLTICAPGAYFEGGIAYEAGEPTLATLMGGMYSADPVENEWGNVPSGYGVEDHSEEDPGYYLVQAKGTPTVTIEAPADAVLSYSVDEETWTPISGTTFEVSEPGTYWVKAVLSDGVGQKILSTEFEDESVTVSFGTAVDYGWYFTGNGTEAEPYLIVDANGLVNLKSAVACGLSGSGKYFRMSVANATVDLSTLGAWEGIGKPGGGATGNIFTGVFDGNGVTFNNLKLSRRKYAGLFNTVTNATLKNFTINTVGFDSTLAENGTEYGGAVVAGYAAYNVTFQNITVTGSISATDDVSSDLATTNKAHNVGGLASKIDGPNTRVIACTNRASVSTAYTKAGGFAAFSQSYATAEAPVSFENCSNEGSVSAGKTASNPNSGAGGYVGWVSTCLTFTGCSSTGTVTAPDHSTGKRAASFVGCTTGGGTIVGVNNTAKATMTSVNPKTNDNASTVTGFAFATVADNVATFVADSAAVAGATLKVMMPGKTPAVTLAKDETIAFDQALATITDTGIVAATGLKEVAKATVGDVTTYTGVAYATVTVTVTGGDNATAHWTVNDAAAEAPTQLTEGDTYAVYYTANEGFEFADGAVTNAAGTAGTTAIAITIANAVSPAPAGPTPTEPVVLPAGTSEADAKTAAAAATPVIPEGEAKDAGQASVVKCAAVQNASTGLWEIQVVPDESKMPEGKTVKDTVENVAAELSTIAAAEPDGSGNVTVAKPTDVTPGLYYSLGSSATVGGTYEEGPRVLATSAGLGSDLTVKKPEGAKAFFKVMVNTAPSK